jgi:hypothetical protein
MINIVKISNGAEFVVTKEHWELLQKKRPNEFKIKEKKKKEEIKNELQEVL